MDEKQRLRRAMMDLVRLCVDRLGAPEGYRVGVHQAYDPADKWTVWAVRPGVRIMGEATRPFPIPREAWELTALVKGAIREAVGNVEALASGHLGG